MAGTEAKREPLDRATITALVALSVALFLIANDFTALSVALPHMEGELDTDVTTVQWVINAYALVFGVLIVTGGRIADLYGRRNTFFVGAGIFAVFSALAGAAPSIELLILGRALMGIGGALMWPAVLGLTYQVLPQSRQQLAGPLILGVCGIGNALGPLLGGVLTEEASWRWVLLINVPLAAAAVAITYRNVATAPPEPTDETLDYKGVTALSLGLIALLVALDQASDWGWGDWRILALFAVCVASLVAFVAIERGAGTSALIPQDVARNRPFIAACVATLLMSATFFAILFFIPQAMQKLMGFDAIQSGLGFLPFMVVFSVFAFASGPLYDIVGGRRLLLAGAALIPLGLLALSFVQADSSYRVFVPGLIIAGVGVGLFYSTLTTEAITALPQVRASLGGGVMYMAQIAGGSIGLGLTTAVFSAVQLSHDRGGPQQETEAFTAGLRAGLRLDVALALGSLAVIALFIGRRPRPHAHRAAATEPG